MKTAFVENKREEKILQEGVTKVTFGNIFPRNYATKCLWLV